MFLSVGRLFFSQLRFCVQELNELSLERLQRFVDQGRIDTSKRITLKSLVDAGLVTRIRHGLKLLGNGADTFAARVDIEVTAVSESAKAAIERAGGSVTTVYFNRLGLLTHLRNEPDDVKIRFARAPPELWKRFDVPKYPSPVDKLSCGGGGGVLAFVVCHFP